MNPEDLEDDLRPEYDFDFSKAVRGKYYKQYEVIAKFQKVQDFISEAEDKNEVLLCKIR